MKNKILLSGVLIALSGCSSPMISYDAYLEQPFVYLSKDAINNENIQKECGIKKCVASGNTVNCDINDDDRKEIKIEDTHSNYRFLGKSETEYYFSAYYPYEKIRGKKKSYSPLKKRGAFTVFSVKDRNSKCFISAREKMKERKTEQENAKKAEAELKEREKEEKQKQFAEQKKKALPKSEKDPVIQKLKKEAGEFLTFELCPARYGDLRWGNQELALEAEVGRYLLLRNDFLRSGKNMGVLSSTDADNAKLNYYKETFQYSLYRYHQNDPESVQISFEKTQKRLKLSIRDKMSNRLEQIVLRKDGNEISIEKYLNSDRIMADLDENVSFFCYGIWR